MGQGVQVHYTGWLENGQEFDSSYKTGRPAQFALGPGNLFRSGNASSLAERIDRWIDDPAALAEASETYARYADLYAVDRSVKAIERVLQEGPRTRDMGGSANTKEVGKAIAEAL